MIPIQVTTFDNTAVMTTNFSNSRLVQARSRYFPQNSKIIKLNAS